MSNVQAESTSLFQKYPRFFKVLMAIALLLLLLLSLLPTGIRIAAVSWLEGHGVEHAKIENVDLNIFKGSFAIEGLSAGKGLKLGRLAVDIDWLPVLDHRISIRLLELKDFDIEAHQRDDGEWQLATITLDEAEPEEATKTMDEDASEPWQIVLNAISVKSVHLKAAGAIDKKSFDVALLLKSLNLSLVKSETDGAQLLKHVMELGPVSFKGLGYDVKNDGLTLNDTIFLPAMGSDIAAGLKINHLDLKLNDFALLDSHQAAQPDTIKLGQLNMGINSVMIKPLSINDLNVKINGLSLLDSRQSLQLVAVDAIQLDKVNADLKKASFDLLSVQGIGLPTAGSDSLGRIGEVSLHQANLDLAGIYTLKKVAIHDLQASIKKLENGKILVLDKLQPASKASLAPKVEEKASSGEKENIAVIEPVTPSEPIVADKKTTLYIDEFLIEKGSSLAFRDESISPAFHTKVVFETFTFSPVDPTGKQSGKLDALLNLDGKGSLAMNGEFTLNPDDLRADLNIALKNFDMPRLTGFVEGDFGQSIKTGQFNMDSGIKIANNKIDAKNKLLIRKMVIEKAKKTGKAEQSLGMPVDMALDMLRDSRGDISMDVPITGALDDPNINVNDVINQALMSAMSGGVMTYAKLLLQPYGAIYMAAEYAVGAAQDAAKPKLTAIQFNERSTQLGTDMADYVNKIGLLMNSKSFRLEICGVATRSEGTIEPDKKANPDAVPQLMSDEQLLVLAEARSDAVLKAIQAQGIAADRLFNCRPNIDENIKSGKPRVELILD